MGEKQIGILGAGGFAREVVQWANRSGNEVVCLYDSTISEEKYIHIGGKKYLVSNVLFDNLEYVMGVGDPKTKLNILKSCGKVKFAPPVIDPSVIMGDDVSIGDGSVICPNVILTTNISIGICSSINIGSTVGHDCIIGDYFNAAPSANISGNINIDNEVSVGTNACIREKLSITSEVIIGMGAVVTKNITESGVYVGSPVKRIK